MKTQENLRFLSSCLLTSLAAILLPAVSSALEVHDDFDDGVLDPNWQSYWGMYVSEGNSAGDPGPPARPPDIPGRLTTNTGGWLVYGQDNDPAFQGSNATIMVTGVDNSGVAQAAPDDVFNAAGVDMGIAGRFNFDENASPDTVSSVLGQYVTTNRHSRGLSTIEIREFGGSPIPSFGPPLSTLSIGRLMENPFDMSMTLMGDEVVFTVTDALDSFSVMATLSENPAGTTGSFGIFNAGAIDNDNDYSTYDAFWVDILDTPNPADLDDDGDVDGKDFLGSQLLGQSAVNDWKGSYPIPAPLSGVAGVPEPTSYMMFLFGAAWSATRARRARAGR